MGFEGCREGLEPSPSVLSPADLPHTENAEVTATRALLLMLFPLPAGPAGPWDKAAASHRLAALTAPRPHIHASGLLVVRCSREERLLRRQRGRGAGRGWVLSSGQALALAPGDRANDMSSSDPFTAGSKAETLVTSRGEGT